MPLSTGRGSVKSNIEELMRGKPSTSRQKAIKTIAKKYGISLKNARLKQALAIAHSQATK